MKLDTNRLDTLLRNMGKSRILILGDIMLDEYVFGQVDRISPEAPVPVVEVLSTNVLVGGAANVAANIRALGDDPVLMGVVGTDDAAGRLSALLQEKSIPSDYIISDASRQTTVKTRIIAHSQQVVRADREDRRPLSDAVETELFDRVRAMASEISAVVISDYGKGVITPSLLEKVIELCRQHDIFVGVDPKETNFPNYKRVSLITPNHHEAGFAYGRRIITDEDLMEVGSGLMSRLDARAILITRGSHGMSLFSQDDKPTHIPTFARHVFDVTGAGDTVIATFVAAVSGGATLKEAAVVANAAAGHTVGEVGTATISLDQLKAELEHNIRNGNVVAIEGAV